MKKLVLSAVLGLVLVATTNVEAKTKDKVYPSKAKQYIVGGDMQSVYFLARFVSPDMVVKGANGMTMLNFAIIANQPEIAKYLISKGASLEGEYNGMTPLAWAIQTNQTDLATYILDNYVPSDKETQLALEIATQQNNTEMVELLRPTLAVE